MFKTVIGIFPADSCQTMDPQQRLQLECAYEAMESGMLLRSFFPHASFKRDAK